MPDAWAPNLTPEEKSRLDLMHQIRILAGLEYHVTGYDEDLVHWPGIIRVRCAACERNGTTFWKIYTLEMIHTGRESRGVYYFCENLEDCAYRLAVRSD